MHADAIALIETLGLTAHPEGGYYRETFRAPLRLEALPHGGPRNASTAIYFLLPSGSHSAWHKVRSDEIWHFYDGDPLELHLLNAGGHRVIRLGRDVQAGEQPQVVVPADVWQAAVPMGDRYSLCGCTVAPGFDFADFEMPHAAAMAALFPQQEAIARRLSRMENDKP